MTCTRPGCGNIQCYVCHKSCDYSHFNDRGTGARGNCPLFDSTAERHENEVKEAEEKIRRQVLQENPDVNENQLKIDFSKNVQEDDEQRKKMEPHHGRQAYAGFPG